MIHCHTRVSFPTNCYTSATQISTTKGHIGDYSQIGARLLIRDRHRVRVFAGAVQKLRVHDMGEGYGVYVMVHRITQGEGKGVKKGKIMHT